MSEPTFVPLSVGDPKDDDGIVIDSFFEPVSESPDPESLNPVLGETTPETFKRPVPTRIISGSLLVDPTWAPQMILPPDTDRQSLHIRVKSPTAVAADYVLIAGDPGQCGTSTGSGRLYNGESLSLDEHTGPLYIAPFGATVVGPNPSGASAALLVSWWAVTL